MDRSKECDAAHLIPDAPDSVKTVLCALEDHEPATNKTLQEKTGLPRRTLYTALQKLQAQGLVKRQISLRDTRQTYFWLPDDVTVAAAS